jgi:archaetidylinositol phosphate synthase
MVLDTQRENVDPFFMAIAKRFSKVDPNVLTWLSLVFAIVAGLFFYFSSKEFESVNFFLCVAVIFVSLNGLFDAIDGKVAKLTNKVSKKGDFLDHALDRYADVFMVGGLALSS